MATFSDLWANHPGKNSKPCDPSFDNQCAIRMSVALDASGVDTSGFDAMYPKRRCWFGHAPGHILGAEELAHWMKTKADEFGSVKIYRSDRSGVNGKQGIVFIRDGWGRGDHIDLWNRTSMKAGRTSWLKLGSELWFWPMG